MFYKGLRKRGLAQIVIGALIAVMLCVVFALSGMGIAYADGTADGTDPSAPGNNGSPDDPKADIVYFTDYARNSVLREVLTNQPKCGKIELIYFDHDTFEKDVRDAYYRGEYDEIFEKLIIFEMRYGFKSVKDPYEIENEIEDELFVYTLRKLFGDLKERGCRIMFINGSDERLLESEYEYTDFLEYVDIHVNTDIMSVFLSSILNEENNKSPLCQLKNCTIILDKNFAPDIDSIREEVEWSNWSVKYTIMPFLMYIWNEYPADFLLRRDFLVDKNVSIYFDLGVGYLYKLNDRQTYTYDTVADDFTDKLNNDFIAGKQCETIFAIGGTWGDIIYTQEWADDIFGMRSRMVQNIIFDDEEDIKAFFPIYIYNSNGMLLPDYENDFVHRSKSVYISKFNEIAVDFLNGEPLDKHNNYTGRCGISHKLIKFRSPDEDPDDDAWMTWPMDSMYGECWECNMDEDEYTMYFAPYIY